MFRYCEVPLSVLAAPVGVLPAGTLRVPLDENLGLRAIDRIKSTSQRLPKRSLQLRALSPFQVSRQWPPSPPASDQNSYRLNAPGLI
ncbi:hypothetical protein CYMTET_15649 [Cymbomonas tetramitiformis]|uniref:Uncharacterized protein n=1 Tax=Cymbomonas tetramitiformis TaxID=36881 RepID=A0AAE0GE17_9CHLO|nr:hypothetical protein CYMTET_15649 [Cymbomonas tetramitiformis]